MSSKGPRPGNSGDPYAASAESYLSDGEIPEVRSLQVSPVPPKRGGFRKQTKKLKRGGAATTRKNSKMSESFKYKTIHWFSIDAGANKKYFSPENFNMGFVALDAVTNASILGAATALTGGVAVAASSIGFTGLSTALAGLGLALSWPVVGLVAAGGLALTVVKGIASTENHAANATSAVERLLFNQMLGYFYSFNRPEDNIYIVNLMTAEIFGGDSLEVKDPITAGENSSWVKKLPDIFAENYVTALKSRERIFTQITEYASITKLNTQSSVNIKNIIAKNDGTALNKSNFLSFYMDASFITAAMKAYPSTYNPVTGGQLQDYNKNRTKFLEDYAAGKYDKKK
jgi:hypothetical protein